VVLDHDFLRECVALRGGGCCGEEAMIDFSPPPKFWVPAKPAIIRAASANEIERARRGSLVPGMSGVAALMMANSYHAGAVAFDGASDFLTRGAGLTGAADSKLCTGSIWFKINTGAASARLIGSATAAGGSTLRFRVTWDQTDERVTIVGINPGGTTVVSLTTSNGSVPDGSGWHHILWSLDMANAAKRHVYLDDASDLGVSIYTNDMLDFTLGDWSVGSVPDGGNKLNGDMADVWIAFGVYIDISVEANRRKFVTAEKKPVDLGATGALVSGSSPLLYLSRRTGETTVQWATNKGTGGGFTVAGVLSDAATSPSD
jgi:hypothetical protein